MELSAQQGEAVKLVVNRLRADKPPATTYIGGFAGTGKSTILPFVLDDTGIDPKDIMFLAPTGKAAKIMSRKLRDQGFGNTVARTIHSAIYKTKPAPIAQLENELRDLQHQRDVLMEEAHCGASNQNEMRALLQQISMVEANLDNVYREDEMNFQLNHDSILSLAKLCVVDEASMVGRKMAADLKQFGVPILAMGDPGQLPPVGDDPGLTAGDPDFFLTEIHRQAADNPIIKLATLARRGRELPLGEHRDPDGVVRARVMYRSDFDAGEIADQFQERLRRLQTGEVTIEDANPIPQVLCGTNKTRWRSTRMFREGLPPAPVYGEQLIVRKNFREYQNLVNGALVNCTSHDAVMVPGRTSLSMTFRDDDGVDYENLQVFQGLFEEHYTTKKNNFSSDSRSAWQARKRLVQLDYAAVLTVHNYQGSQADHVVLIDESNCFREDADKHLYTGLTRAAETITVLI